MGRKPVQNHLRARWYGLLSAVLVSFLAAAPVPAQEKRPNFLLVVADDLGWTDIGSFGSEIDTPNRAYPVKTDTHYI